MIHCSDKCRHRGSLKKNGCKITCCVCEFICEIDGCEIEGGCDAIAVAKDTILIIEAKGGRLRREDAKDAVRQLLVCLEKYRLDTLRDVEVIPVVMYKSRVESYARTYLYKGPHELKRKGLKPILHRCGDDLSRIIL